MAARALKLGAISLITPNTAPIAAATAKNCPTTGNSGATVETHADRAAAASPANPVDIAAVPLTVTAVWVAVAADADADVAA